MVIIGAMGLIAAVVIAAETGGYQHGFLLAASPLIISR
jgi:hypothetical protein